MTGRQATKIVGKTLKGHRYARAQLRKAFNVWRRNWR
jgi:hypothetical protein